MNNEFELNRKPESLEESDVIVRVSGEGGIDSSFGIVACKGDGLLDLSNSDETRVRMEFDFVGLGTAVRSRVSDCSGSGSGNEELEKGRSSDARVCSFVEPMISIPEEAKSSSHEEVKNDEDSDCREMDFMDFEVEDGRSGLLNVPNGQAEHMGSRSDESESIVQRPSTNKFDTRNDPFEFTDNQEDVSSSSRSDQAGAGNSALSPNDSELSKEDDYVANRAVIERSMSKDTGFSLEPGEMVWGKVKSHPWWPGHIFSEASASSSVRRTKREGHVLVAFFGDSSYGWFDPSELVPFDSNFAEKSQQVNLRAFAKAAEEALDEASRRCFLGLICRCRNPYNFRPADVQGHFVVDVGDYIGGVYSEMQIRKARESFQPVDTLAFIRQLAMGPCDNDHNSIYSIKNTAKVFAYRKAIFEEFDETYAEAFGFDPESPSPNKVIKEASKQAHRAPLSGPMVFAEALGGAKSAPKSASIKNQSNKDKYLLKRRDEQYSSNSIHITGASSEIAAGEYILQKRAPAHHIKPQGMVKDEKHTFLSTPKVEGTINLENKPIVKEETDKEKTVMPFTVTATSMRVDGSVSSSFGNNQQEDEKKVKKGEVVKRPIGNLGYDASIQGDKKLKPDQRQKYSSSTGKRVDSIINSQLIDFSNINLELPQLLNDLHFAAVDHFHGADRNIPAIIRHVFLRFRALVYQKSSAVEIEGIDSGADGTPAGVKLSDQDFPARKPPRPMGGRPDDPAKGGRKRAPSDRQEEMATKKQKKNHNIISMAAEKKTVCVEGKETLAPPKKLVRLIPAKKVQSPARVVNPTMLVMKFPLQTSLPSSTELKARFARFGPLDHDETRIFWKTSSCRIVFRYKIDAQKAFKHAIENKSLFGNINVRYFLRDTAENHDSGKVHTLPDPSSIPTGTELRLPTPTQQPPVQLKSCLKKVSGDDSGNNNGGRGPRVKFALEGEEEQKSMMTNAGSSNSSTSNNFQNIIIPSLSQFTKTPQNTYFNNAPPQPPPPRTTTTTTTPVSFLTTPTTVDISQPMLNLLTKCNDVVSNVRSMLGYVPYHPL